MAAPTISYGSYTFPTPSPFIAESSSPIFISGQSDFFIDNISVIGTLTGSDLSGIVLQKGEMITGLLSEFQTLKITGDSEGKVYSGAKPTSISFSQSDLTTTLPYSVSFEAYSSGSFSNFFGITDPQDSWSFAEQDGRVTSATHTVSAKGLNLGDGVSALDNARNFVTGRGSGISQISLFQSGHDAFLQSRTESIDKAANVYSTTEEYIYSTTQNRMASGLSGVLDCSSSISLDGDGKVSITINGNLQGSMDANLTGALLTTGNFTPENAKEVATNILASSLSDYESGVYGFSDRGPSSYNYNLNTGSNTLSFSFTFNNETNTEQSGNILHSKSASVSSSKDDANTKVTVNGQLSYNSDSRFTNATGDPTTSQEWYDLQNELSGINFFDLATEAFKDFTGCATGYSISGVYLNPVAIESGIDKNPFDRTINYNVSFDTKLDLSDGDLKNLKVSISDTKPISVSGIKPSLAGFAKQKTKNRSIGLYSVSASAEGTSGDFSTLETTVNKYITGVFDQAKSESLGDNTISFNLSRFY